MSAPLRRPRLDLRPDGATYLVCWSIHPGQAPLAGTERRAVIEALCHSEAVDLVLTAALALEEKVYVLVTLSALRSLGRTVGLWKQRASRQLIVGGRAPPLWRRGYVDRIMRDSAEVARRVEQLRRLADPHSPGALKLELSSVRGEEPSADRRPTSEDRLGEDGARSP
jgi:hypothetical protein